MTAQEPLKPSDGDSYKAGPFKCRLPGCHDREPHRHNTQSLMDLVVMLTKREDELLEKIHTRPSSVEALSAERKVIEVLKEEWPCGICLDSNFNPHDGVCRANLGFWQRLRVNLCRLAALSTPRPPEAGAEKCGTCLGGGGRHGHAEGCPDQPPLGECEDACPKCATKAGAALTDEEPCPWGPSYIKSALIEADHKRKMRVNCSGEPTALDVLSDCYRHLVRRLSGQSKEGV